MQETTIDRQDVQILAALQAHGRLSNQELAEQIGLSASQCSRRRAALEESGVISTYRAVLSRERLGLSLIVFVEISLARHSATNATRLAQLLNDMEEVQQAYSLTGDADYLVKLVVPDLSRLSEILNNVLLPYESVARVRSSIVLDLLKDTSELPLGHLQI